MIGGIGRLVGAMTGGGGYGIMPGRLTSSTIRGSLPWSNAQRSPRTQNPFSANEIRKLKWCRKHICNYAFIESLF